MLPFRNVSRLELEMLSVLVLQLFNDEKYLFMFDKLPLLASVIRHCSPRGSFDCLYIKASLLMPFSCHSSIFFKNSIISFTSTGVGKAKSAMEAARARKTRLMQIQKDEDEVVRNFPEFSAISSSRPVSGEITQAEKVKCSLSLIQHGGKTIC